MICCNEENVSLETGKGELILSRKSRKFEKYENGIKAIENMEHSIPDVLKNGNPSIGSKLSKAFTKNLSNPFSTQEGEEITLAKKISNDDSTKVQRRSFGSKGGLNGRFHRKPETDSENFSSLPAESFCFDQSSFSSSNCSTIKQVLHKIEKGEIRTLFRKFMGRKKKFEKKRRKVFHRLGQRGHGFFE